MNELVRDPRTLCEEQQLLARCMDQQSSMANRSQACLTLGTRRSRTAVPSLLGLMSLGNLGLAYDASRALAQIGSRTATKPLLRLLRQNRGTALEGAIISTLSALRDERARRAFLYLLFHATSDSVRALAAQALMFLPGRKNAQQALFSALADPAPIVRWSVINTLSRTVAAADLGVLNNHVRDDCKVEELPDRPTVGSAAVAVLEEIRASQNTTEYSAGHFEREGSRWENGAIAGRTGASPGIRAPG